MYMTSIAIDFWQPSFSRDSLMPLAASFSLLTKNDGVSERGSVSDLCSSEVVPEELFLFTDPVGEGAGLVATHSNCSIYTEATNAYKLGYSYVVLLADYQSSPNDYRLDTHAHAHTNTTHNLEETLLHHSLTEVEEEELRKLDIFVAIVSTNDYNRALYLSSRYQNSISQPLRSEDEIKETVLKFKRPQSPSAPLAVCMTHIENSLKYKRLHLLRASAYDCLDNAITTFQMGHNGQGQKLSGEELARSVDLAQSLWDQDFAVESTLLTNWILARQFSEIPVNEAKAGTLSSVELTSFLRLASLLFETGEFSSARKLIDRNVDQSCARMETIEGTEGVVIDQQQCQQSCSLLFVASFSTLDSNAHTHDFSVDDNEEWTVEVPVEPVEQFGQSQSRIPTLMTTSGPDIKDEDAGDGDVARSSTSLETCVDILQHETFEVMQDHVGEVIDGVESGQVNDWISLIMAHYRKHPAFWLSVSELEFLGNKWGMTNIMRYVNTIVEDSCSSRGTCSHKKDTVPKDVNHHGKSRAEVESRNTKVVDALRSHTSHMATFLASLDTTLSTCNKDSDIGSKTHKYDTDDYCRRSVLVSGERVVFHLNDMPRSSFDILKKYANSRNKKVMRRTGIRMFQNDLSESHIRLSFFWNDYGSFSSSQNHFLARVSRVQCLSKTLRGDISTSKVKDLCSPEQVKLMKAEVGDIGCLYQRNMMATPAIFGTNDEFNSYRRDQLKQIDSLQQMIFPLIDVSYEDILEQEFNGSFLTEENSLSEVGSHKHEYTNEFLTTLQERYFLLADERKMFDTPPASSVGYTFELQEIVKALAPSSAVVPSGGSLLERGAAVQEMCEHSGVASSFIPEPPPKHRTPSEENIDGTKIKVGFLSRFFYDHPVGNMLVDIILNLNQSIFDVHLLCVCCPQSMFGREGIMAVGDDVSSLGNVQQKFKGSPNVIWSWLGSENGSSLPSGPIDEEKCNWQLATNPVVFQTSAKSVAALDLDVLVYPELGLDRQTISFANLRLATTQAVFHGHPISQRFKHIDYFISSALYEVHDPKCQFPRLYHEKCPFHFTSKEHVLQLDELPVMFSPQPDDISSGGGVMKPDKDPFSSLYDSLALPVGTIDMMDKHVYLLLHPIKVYSTVFIRTIASILLKDPIGFVVILYNAGERLWFEKLRRSVYYHIKKLDCHTNKVDRATGILKHFPEMHGYVTQKDCIVSPSKKICKLCCECSDVTHVHSVARRLLLLPHPTSSGSGGDVYRKYIRHCSVVLDSFPVGMDAQAAVEVLETGMPIISLPSFQTTPSTVLGLIRKLDVNSSMFIADSISDYASLAVQITQRSTTRDALMKTLKERSSALFSAKQKAAVVAEWEKMLSSLSRGRRS